MISLSLNQFLLLYIWFPLVILLVFVSLIARFYERFSGARTYFQLFALPVVFFGMAFVRYASLDALMGDMFADTMMGIAGILLVVLCWRVFRLMIVQHKS
jgi:hypothetical protein